MESIYCFLTASVRRHDIFKQSQTKCNLPVFELPQQSDTRWVCKHRAVKVFVNRFGSIIDTLTVLSGSDSAPKERVEAKGLLMQLSSLNVLFILQLLDQVLPTVNALSEYLQSQTVDVTRALALVKATKHALSCLRCDSAFEKLFSTVLTAAASHSIEVTDQLTSTSEQVNQSSSLAPRPRRLPAQLADSIDVMSTTGCRAVSGSTSKKTQLKREMFEVVDKMEGELTRRFSANTTELKAFSTVNPASDSFLSFADMLPVAEQLAYMGIDADKLRGQTSVALSMFKSAKPDDVVKEPKQVLPALSEFGVHDRPTIKFTHVQSLFQNGTRVTPPNPQVE